MTDATDGRVDPETAVARIAAASRRQRRVESVVLVAVLLGLVGFQLLNRSTVLSSKRETKRELGKALGKLDEANVRIGQLEQALRAAGAPVPPAAPPSTTTTVRSNARPPSSTSTTTTTARAPAPPNPSPSPTTTSTSTTTSSTVCALAVNGRCLL